VLGPAGKSQPGPPILFLLRPPSENLLFPQCMKPLLDSVPRLLPVDAVALLNAPDENVAVAGDHIQIFFGESAPPVP
jgi:hypothetical protein